MDHYGTNVAYLSFDQVCDINRKMIEKKGGLFTPPKNLLNPGSLEYILTDVADPDLDISNHIVLKEIAAKIGYHIITRHVFNDGNKRTAGHIAWAFLRANGVRAFLDSTIIYLTKSIAEKNATLNDFSVWLKNHQES